MYSLQEAFREMSNLMSRQRSGSTTSYEETRLNNLREYFQLRRDASKVVLRCCKEIGMWPTVTMVVDFETNPTTARWEASVPAEAALRAAASGGVAPLPKVCPFCGTLLPRIVAKDPIPEGCVCISMDGDYCDNCHHRLNECLCLHPTTAFELMSK